MRGEEEGREEDGEDGPPAGRSHRVGMIMRALFSVIQLAVEGGKGGKAVGTQIQFASRTREPASRLVPLLARTPSFEAQSMYLAFLYPMRDPMRGTTHFQRFRSWSGIETSSKRDTLCATLYAGHIFPGFRS